MASVAEAEDSWKNLERIRLDREYTVVFRDGRCINGRLTVTDDNSLIIESVPSDRPAGHKGDAVHAVTVKRADVIRVSDTTSADPHDVIYNGRSSWADLVTSRPGNPEWLRIVSKTGEEQKCKQPTFSVDRVKCDHSTVAKSEIARVYPLYLPLPFFRCGILDGNAGSSARWNGSPWAPILSAILRRTIPRQRPDNLPAVHSGIA